MKRAAGFLIALALTVTIPVTAHGGGRTSFHSETSALPFSTMTGDWSGSGKRVRLEIDGGHAAGDYTRFVGRWVTPWSNPRKTPSVEGEFQLEGVDPVGGNMSIGLLVRDRIKGRPWSKWYGSPEEFKFRQGYTMFAGGLGGGLLMSKPRRVRYDVKLVGRMDGVSALSGYLELMLRDPN